ncbi:hypothetical protein GCM10011586_12860 [Silvibacterium dinghuense]|nr:hypothetical protein GCM10011586_12860 [Silvibacterium dinghuense]
MQVVAALDLAAEYIEQGELTHAELMACLELPLDMRLDAVMQEGKRAPALGQGGG